jgi:hypothetical protein
MNLQLTPHNLHAFLPSGILIVEPHEGLLAARTLLLAAVDYHVGVSGFNGMKAPQGRCDGYKVAVAILSESLGRCQLTAMAQAVRQRWPFARILIFGRTDAAIEDNLYDARIDHTSRPEDLLCALDILSIDPWNQRARPAGITANAGPQALSRTSGMLESDPTKRFANSVSPVYQRELPGDEQRFKQAF